MDPQVLAGGTEVQWTHVGPGTGNFPTDKHVDGFRVFADGAVNGLVTVASSGISRDTFDPLPDGSFNLDFTGTVAGPTAVPEPSSLILACLGLAGLAGYAAWGRLRGWPRLLANRSRGATRGREEPRCTWATAIQRLAFGGK